MRSSPRLFLSLIVFLCIIPAINFAENNTPVISDLSTRGITYEVKQGQLNVTIVEEKALAAIPELQSKGVLPKNITPDHLKKMQVTAAVEAVGMSYTVALVHSIFMNDPNLQSLHVTGYLVSKNSSIFSEKKPCFSFEINRDVYNSINWDVISTKDFMAKTTNFKLEDWCKDRIQAEINNY